MNWKNIQISSDLKSFELDGKKLFNKEFKEVLKFHEPGYAPVCDENGWHHIDLLGKPIYESRYKRAFGYYFKRAAVIDETGAFHITDLGEQLYTERYKWCGNYQEEICVVKLKAGSYIYINLAGKRLFEIAFIYAGDFKDGFASVKTTQGWTHISKTGSLLHGKHFLDLGVYHKGFATARDQKGWFHIDMKGNELYKERFIQIEPFYNGISLVHDMNWNTQLVNENGQVFELQN